MDQEIFDISEVVAEENGGTVQETVEQPIVVQEPGHEYVQTGGVIGLFVTIIGALFTVWLRERRNAVVQKGKDELFKKVCVKIDKQDEVLSIMRKKLEDLHDWHNVVDEDNVKVWYIRKSLERSMERLAENIDKQTEILRELLQEQKDLRRDVRSQD